MGRKPLATAVALLFAGLLTGCDLDDFLDRFNPVDPCSTASGPIDVAGTWRLTATGTRSSCDDSRRDGDFRIPAVELRVLQSADPNNTSRHVLALAQVPPVPGGTFSLTGDVRGTCVDFTTQETGNTGSFRFVFDGNRDGSDIAGDFTGEGPPGCRSSGRFRIVIER
jgi:hypothetical protein